MKKFTREEFKNFEIINGKRQCPQGDYSDIRNFGEHNSFGEWNSFSEGCSFGKGAKMEGKFAFIDFTGIDRIGSRRAKTYFYNFKEGQYVRCGCWFGTLKDFEERVKKTYPDKKNQYRREYDAAIQMIKTLQKEKS